MGGIRQGPPTQGLGCGTSLGAPLGCWGVASVEIWRFHVEGRDSTHVVMVVIQRVGVVRIQVGRRKSRAYDATSQDLVRRES